MIAVPSSPSGLPAVDRQWGGLAAGRTYLLVGRAGAGRSALALQAARASIDAGERCLIISPRAPESLVEIGQSVGLDLAAAHGAGALRLLRIPSAADLAARGPEGLAKSYRDLAGLVTSDKPGRVIIEDFTPLVQFDTFERFHDAFSELVAELRAQGTTLLIGLGDPANDASRRLLDVVEGLVDGTIRLGSGGDLALAMPGHAEYPSNDGSLHEVIPPPAPKVDDASETPPDADLPQASADPLPSSAPATSAPSAPAPEEPAPEDDAPQAPAPQPDTPASSGFETTFSASKEPSTPVAAAEPAPSAPEPAPLAQTPPAQAPAPLALPVEAEPQHEAPSASGLGALVETDIVTPPPAEHGLADAGTDPFGLDPADALLEQGFLADSGIGAPVLAPPPPSPALAVPPAGMPSFAPLGGAAPPAHPNAGFRTALDAAFAARATGTPFQVVALRIEPAAPAAAHFAAVEAGLRATLRPGDAILVDPDWKRAAVVLPDSGPEAGQALFTGLQTHLSAALGAEAGAVLQGVAAVTISDGQPFQSAADLVAYAVES